MRCGALAFITFVVVALGPAGPAGAVVLGPGDLLVGTQDSGSPGGPRLILHVSATTGVATQMARGAFDNVRGLAVETGGQIVALDVDNFWAFRLVTRSVAELTEDVTRGERPPVGPMPRLLLSTGRSRDLF
jgi:hypothetical protein